LQAATLDWLTDRIVDALARGERVGPPAVLLLLHRFSAGRHADLAQPLGAALASEMDLQARQGCAAGARESEECAGWLAVFSQAAIISDDPRLPRAAADLLTGVRSSWGPPSGGPIRLKPDPTGGEPDPAGGETRGILVATVMRAVEACLVSVNVPEARELAAEAIDALERAVAGAYRPGEGMSHRVAGSPFVRGALADQVRSASALLTAYMLTARLPYAMLADELMQRVVRAPAADGDAPFALACDAARVLCRLAALHHDDEYRRTAVLAIDTDYVHEATRALEALAPSVRELGADAAPFGLALAEWLEVR
jgi:hypothetical protein